MIPIIVVVVVDSKNFGFDSFGGGVSMLTTPELFKKKKLKQIKMNNDRSSHRGSG